jgi:putative acetyltransferase
VLVRRSTPADAAAARAIHAAAFERGEGTPGEVALVDALVADGDAIAALALVAERDGVAVGHVVCSRAWVGAVEVAALGPIGVLPEHQGSGVGTALMHAVVAAADALELQLLGLVGHPAYYRRFGFVRGSSIGVEPPDPAWDQYFQARTLSAYGGVRGRFRYAAAFKSL